MKTFSMASCNRGRSILSKVSFIIVLMSVFCSLEASAQDRIITKDAKDISAYITEVNIDDIKYRRADNQDGPVYTLPKSEISTIIYANGAVEVFNDEPAPDSRQSGSMQNQGNSRNQIIGILGAGGCYFDPDNPMPITRANNNYFYNGAAINATTAELIISSYDPSLSDGFKSAKSRMTAGNVLAGIGGGLIGGGLGALIWADTETEVIAAGVLIGLGTIIGLPIAMPIFYSGQRECNSIVDRYNSHVQGYARKPSCEINFGAAPHGIGLTMAF